VSSIVFKMLLWKAQGQHRVVTCTWGRSFR